MNQIQKNFTAIEQKFLSLKATHQLYQQPTPIGEVSEVITYGVITEQEVDKFLQYVHSSPQIQAKQKINQKWYDLSIDQMIFFLDKVIKFRNINKQKQDVNKQKGNQSPKRKKTKKQSTEGDQIQTTSQKVNFKVKKLSVGKVLQYGENNNKNQIISPLSNNLSQSNQNQNNNLANQLSPKYSLKQTLQKTLQKSLQRSLEKSLTLQKDTTPSSKQSKIQHITFGLPQNFYSLPIQQKYSVLLKKYDKDRVVLQSKFDSIYKHYRKEMYIPFESFQINHQLMMDMRLFLKYVRQFDLTRRFNTNEAIKLFKKIAINGLWLDDKKFIDIHYKLAEIIQIDDATKEELNQQKLTKQQAKNFGVTQTKDENKGEQQNEISKKMKVLVQNIVKVYEISGLLSADKIRQILYNIGTGKNTVKKIVQAHSGLTKQDVMLKLQQRAEERKSKKGYLLGIIKVQKQSGIQTEKSKYKNKSLDKTQKLNPARVSIYKQLNIPNLRPRQMKKSSVYSSLQLLQMHKQKEKLKQLINEQDNEEYLQAFFRKQKQLLGLPRNLSLALSRLPTQIEESNINVSVKSTKMIKNLNADGFLPRNFSLPRMKFT